MTRDEVVIRNQILIGDAHERLSELPSGSVDMLLTSPPYYRLRDYQIHGQLGLEPHIDEWVKQLRLIAQQAARILTPTGSMWLNLADTYATHYTQGAARKSLLLGPERVLLALADDGWSIRNKIVWQKPNPMPSSVTDRLSATWEALYVCVRQPSYFFDLDAIRVPHRTTATGPRRVRIASKVPAVWRGPNTDDALGLTRMHAAGRVGHPLGKNPGDVWTIATRAVRGHHATYPVDFAATAIRAGCPEARCPACRMPRRRGTRRTGSRLTRGPLQARCDCDAGREPGLVLDPFLGSGTTAIAAEQLGRDWLGVELNPRFARLAAQRIAQHRPNPP